LCDVSKIRGQLVTHGPIFEVKKDHLGLVRGEIVALTAVPLDAEGIPGVEGARKALMSLIKGAILHRIGTLEDSPDGHVVVACTEPDYYLAPPDGPIRKAPPAPAGKK
jgi:hypothetical protein